MVVMKGYMINNLYVLHGKVVMKSSANVASAINDNTKLWHLKLGHIGLLELSKQKLLCGITIDKLELCENYIFIKSSRLIWHY